MPNAYRIFSMHFFKINSFCMFLSNAGFIMNYINVIAICNAVLQMYHAEKIKFNYHIVVKIKPPAEPEVIICYAKLTVSCVIL